MPYVEEETKKLKSIANMNEDELRHLAIRKLTAFVCETCDLGGSATSAQLDALPNVAEVLLEQI